MGMKCPAVSLQQLQRVSWESFSLSLLIFVSFALSAQILPSGGKKLARLSHTLFSNKTQWQYIRTIPLNQTAINELAEQREGSNLKTKSSGIITGLKIMQSGASSAGWLPLCGWIFRSHFKGCFHFSPYFIGFCWSLNDPESQTILQIQWIK